MCVGMGCFVLISTAVSALISWTVDQRVLILTKYVCVHLFFSKIELLLRFNIIGLYNV